MTYAIDDEAEVLATVVEHLERLGVTGLRQPYDDTQLNKSAILRYLLLQAYEEALANPPTPAGQIKRSGSASQRKSKVNMPTDTPSKSRKG